MLCSDVNHLWSSRALHYTTLHFFHALPLPVCFTTEQSTAEASLFVNENTTFKAWKKSWIPACLSNNSSQVFFVLSSKSWFPPSLFIWQRTCLGPCPLSLGGKSTCPRQSDSTFVKPWTFLRPNQLIGLKHIPIAWVKTANILNLFIEIPLCCGVLRAV